MIEDNSIKKIMSKPIGINVNSSIFDAINKLLTFQFSRLIIYDSNIPVGIITRKDILRFLFKEKLHKSIQEISVRKIMNDIYYVDNSSSIFDVSKFMIENRCSSVVIGSENDLQGITTKTDLTQFYANEMIGRKKVSEHMSMHYFSVSVKESLYEVIKMMLGFGISRIVILDTQTTPVGIISTGDVFRTVLDIESIGSSKSFFENPIDHEYFWTKYSHLCSQSSGDVMTKKLISISSDEDLAIACKLMLDKKVNALGVKDSNQQLSGIIGKKDIVLVLSKEN